MKIDESEYKTMAEIKKANPTLRKRVLIVVAIIAVIGILLMIVAQSYLPVLSNWILENENQIGLRLRVVLIPIATLLTLPLLIFAVYFWNLGKKVIRCKQFPPPNMSVIKDTPILRGLPACRRGQSAQVVAILLMIFVIVLFTAFWKISIAFG